MDNYAGLGGWDMAYASREDIGCSYGEVVMTRSLILGQTLGLPAPKGYCVFMPKYKVCNSPSPWRLRSVTLCRIIRGYGPLGIIRAVKRSNIKRENVDLYGGRIPIIRVEEIFFKITPKEAIKRIISGEIQDSERNIQGILKKIIEDSGLSIEDFGVTGSYAGGYFHKDSDLDIIVYGSESVKVMYELFVEKYGFKNNPESVIQRKLLGGVIVKPMISLSWRRGEALSNNDKIHVTWIGYDVENTIGLAKIIEGKPPIKRVSANSIVEAGQITALTYPPWIITRDGRIIVSYEYNVGEVFYNGGKITVSGLASEKGEVVYLGLTEYPGEVSIHD